MHTIILLLLTWTNLNIAHTTNDKELVKWDFTTEKVAEGSYLFTATAHIEKGWYIYSHYNGEDGPIPTSFTFNESHIITSDKLHEEGDLIKNFDEMFEMDIMKFKDKVVFTQKYTSSNGDGSLSGYVTYMTCDNEKCLPPKDIDFKVSL